MGSSPESDSGKFPGQRSNFSQTCNLLSQYLKEKGTFGDLNLGLTRSLEPNVDAETKTMNLLPMIEKSGKTEQEKAQMTIFYKGQVIVFDNFPADKAQEIMFVAGKESSQGQNPHSFKPNFNMSPKPADSANDLVNTAPIVVPKMKPQPIGGSDLPITRKNSLTRFLEKRKDRITATAPYQTGETKAAPRERKTWLGFAAEFPQQNGERL